MEVKRSDLEKRICELMAEGFELPIEKLVPEARLYEDLSLDSLDAVDMLVHLEENLGVKVDGERFMHVRVLQDVFNVVCEVIEEERIAANPAIGLTPDQTELS